MKTKLSFSTTLGAALVLLCAAGFTATVSAQGTNSSREDKLRADLQKRFTAADTNADGRLSRDEAKAGMPRVFRSFDAIDEAKTGSITLEQILAYTAKQQGRR